MQYMIIDVDTDEMIDVIDINTPSEKKSYEDAHPDHYLLEDSIEDFEDEFDDFDEEDN